MWHTDVPHFSRLGIHTSLCAKCSGKSIAPPIPHLTGASAPFPNKNSFPMKMTFSSPGPLHRRPLTATVLLALACCTSAHAEDGIAKKGNTFELGTVVVQGKSLTSHQRANPPSPASNSTSSTVKPWARPLPLPPAWR